MATYGPNHANRVEQQLRSAFPSSNRRTFDDELARNAGRILIADDEYGIRRFLKAALGTHGYELSEATTGVEAMNSVRNWRPDVLLLDLGLPDLDGVDVVRALREWTEIPIVILSVRDSEADKIAALDAGADDYLTKPFSPGELLARLRVALRHAVKTEMSPVFVAGDLSVDFARRNIVVRGNKVQLTPTEYEILKVLIRNSDRVLTHRQVIREVWGGGCYEDEMHLLRVNISNLRRKLEADPTRPRYIVTEPGVGYRLRTE